MAKRDHARKFLFTAIQSPYGRALALNHDIDPDNPQNNAALIDGTVNLRSDSAIAALIRTARLWLGESVAHHSERRGATASIPSSRATATAGSARTRPAISAAWRLCGPGDWVVLALPGLTRQSIAKKET